MHNQNKYANQERTQTLKKCIKIILCNVFFPNHQNLDDILLLYEKGSNNKSDFT